MSKQGIVKFIQLADDSAQVPKLQKKFYADYKLTSIEWTNLDLRCQILRVSSSYGLASCVANPSMQHPALAQQQFSSEHVPTICNSHYNCMPDLGKWWCGEDLWT